MGIEQLEKRLEQLEKRVEQLEKPTTTQKVKVKRAESAFSKFVREQYEKLKDSSEYASYQGKDRYMAIRAACIKKWKEQK